MQGLKKFIKEQKQLTFIYFFYNTKCDDHLFNKLFVTFSNNFSEFFEKNAN